VLRARALKVAMSFWLPGSASAVPVEGTDH
jgi:hypothetical protein